MWWFLLPLFAGFVLAGASAFTAEWSRRWGKRGGMWATVLLRVAGIPLWSGGFLLAASLPAPLVFIPTGPVELLGWAVALTGAGLIVWAGGLLGKRSTAPSVADAVETRGPYAHIRHPVYAGVMLELAGVFLVMPKITLAVASALGVMWLLIQARLEERDLLQRATGYRAYMDAVPRFLPRA